MSNANNTQQYQGNCHCGNVSFSFEHEAITSGLRCNCSICIRKGAIMTDFVIPPDELKIEIKDNSLSVYDFDDKTAKHYFCNKCGIYTFNQTFRVPDHYRVNLGCIESIDTTAMTNVALFDGKSL